MTAPVFFIGGVQLQESFYWYICSIQEKKVWKPLLLISLLIQKLDIYSDTVKIVDIHKYIFDISKEKGIFCVIQNSGKFFGATEGAPK